MKKRIPIFSALVFLYGVLDVYQHLSHSLRGFSSMLRFGQFNPLIFKSLFSGLIPGGIMIALGILAILIIEKPQLTSIAGILSVAWAGWSALSMVSGLGNSLRMGGDGITMIYQLLGKIPEVVIIVIWLIRSIKMLQGKIESKKPFVFMQVFVIAFVFVLCSAFSVITMGGSNVVGVLINAVIKCIPMIALYFAANLLHVSFYAPQETPVLKQQHVKTVITYAVVIAIVLAVSFACSSSSSGGGRGDGVNTCRNCGRDVPLVAGFGFCGTCYEGFVDWQETSWDD